MDERDKVFEQKFSGLSDGSKNYILAILEALEFAETPEDKIKKSA